MNRMSKRHGFKAIFNRFYVAFLVPPPTVIELGSARNHTGMLCLVFKSLSVIRSKGSRRYLLVIAHAISTFEFYYILQSANHCHQWRPLECYITACAIFKIRE